MFCVVLLERGQKHKNNAQKIRQIYEKEAVMVKVCPLDPVKVGSRKKESLGEKVSSDQMGPNFTYLIGVWFPKSKANELLRQERVVRSFRVI